MRKVLSLGETNMSIVDKTNALSRIQGASLDLGCGNLKRDKHSIGIDAIDYDAVDVVGDVFEVLERIPESSITSIRSEHFLEHIADVPRLVTEMARVLQPGGKLDITVPHFSNPYYYSDLTHKSVFGLYTLSYFAAESPFRRAVPHYDRTLQFRIERVDLEFKSTPPFFLRHGFKKMLQCVFNATSYLQELYEENFCHIFPCYEIRYQLTKITEPRVPVYLGSQTPENRER